MAQRNGDSDFGFSWVWARRLQSIEASGGNGDDLDHLKSKVRTIAARLGEFRTLFASLEKSGQYTPSGLATVAAERAATVAGEIRKLTDDTLLLEDIRRTKAKLATKAEPDPLAAVLALLKQQEIRATLAEMGVTGNDPITADMHYQEALARGDHEVCVALEGWPLGSPVSRGLIQQGQTQRHAATDPVSARKLQELESFRGALADVQRDALQELPLADDSEIKML